MLRAMSLQSPLGATQSGSFELSRSGLDVAGTRPRDPTGLLALGGLLVTCALVTVSAANTDSFLPESVRPMPRWLAGPFAGSGVDLHVAGSVAVMSLMFACYGLAVRSAPRLSARSVLMCIAAVHALVLLAPALLSTDVFSYQAYARIGDMYGANPYLNGPHAIALDPVYPFIGAKWVTIPSAYGPVFTALSYLLAPLSIVASVYAYKAIAAVASLVIVGLVWNVAWMRGIDPVRAAALVGLNPLLVVYGVGGGHNDILMLAVLVAGIALVLQQRDRVGAGSLVLATGIKLTAGLLLPFALAAAGNPLARRRRRELVLGATVLGAALAAVSFGVFGTGVLHLPMTVHQSQSEGDWHSIPGFVSSRLGLGTAGHTTGDVLAIVFLGVTCWLVRKVWRGELDWIAGAGWATVAMLVTASSLLPWYVAWLMPLAALAHDRRLFRTAIVLTGVVQFIQLLGYIPHGTAFLNL
jgi:alpha-1,6-mannosyltransferase